MAEVDQVFKEIIDDCRNAMGINYTLLVHRHYGNYKKAISEGELVEAADSAHLMAEAIQRQQHYAVHRRLCEFMIEDWKSRKFVSQFASIYRQLALTYDMHTEYLKADHLYDEALALLEGCVDCDEKDAIYQKASLLYNRSQMARKGEGADEIMGYVKQALALYESINNLHGVSISLNHIATIMPFDNIEEKIAVHRRVVALHQSLEGASQNAVALAEINIGYYEVQRGNIDFGIELMSKAVVILEAMSNKRYAALSYLHYARGLVLAGKLNEAMNACNFSEGIFKAHGITKHISEVDTLKKDIEKLQNTELAN